MPDTTRQKKQTRSTTNNRAPQRQMAANESAGEAALDYFTDYARERPEVVAMWAFGLGFVLGWKLRIFQPVASLGGATRGAVRRGAEAQSPTGKPA